MKYKIVAVGKIKEGYFRDAIAEYAKRIERFGKLEIAEISECLQTGIPNEKQIRQILHTEGQAILPELQGYVVVLDRLGKTLDSVEISEIVKNIKLSHSTISFVIGSSHGLDDTVKSKANLVWSFGSITLPHQLARVVLAEQIYRACTIENNIKYHK